MNRLDIIDIINGDISIFTTETEMDQCTIGGPS